MRQVKHNPAFLSDDELRRSFVVRLETLDLLVEAVRENSEAEAAQHVLVIAPRGFGKTTLARRVALAVRRDPELGQRWFPIIFAEESYSVSSAGEFWLEALLHLREATGDPEWRRVHADLLEEPDERRLRDRALARLLDFADEQGKRLLLVVENLDMLLGEQVDENAGWELRHTLQGEARIMLLATAVTRVKQIERSDQALYDLFRIHELEPLDEAECGVLWTALAGVELAGRQARPIQILTGGNPRLLSILASFAAGRSFAELMSDLAELVDEHTSYFKSNLDALPPVERKAYVTLADLWKPATAAEVGRAARLSSNKASALLGRLVGRGMVSVARQQGRTKHYRVAERLYNVYHLMRCRGGAEQRVRAVVEFMVGFYGPDDLAHRLAELAAEACEFCEDERGDHLAAWAQIVERTADPELLKKTISALDPRFYNLELSDSIRELLATPEALRARLERSPEDAGLWTKLAAALFGVLKRKEEGRRAAERALEIDPGSFPGALLHGAYSGETDRLEKQLAAGGESPLPGLRHLAITLVLVLRDTPDPAVLAGAEEHVDAAMKLGLPAVQCRSVRAPIRLARGDADGAQTDFRWLLDAGHESVEVLTGLARACRQTDELEESAEAWERAALLGPEDGDIWGQTGNAWKRIERFERAEAAYRKALTLKPITPSGWLALADVIKAQQGRPDDTASVLLEALHHNASFFPAIKRLMGMAEGEEQTAVERALDQRFHQDPDDHAALLATIWLEKSQEHIERAQQAARRLRALLSGASTSWAPLVHALVGLGDETLLVEAADRFVSADRAVTATAAPEVAFHLAQAGRPAAWERAVEVAVDVLDQWPARAALAWAQAKLGLGDEAMLTLTPLLSAEQLSAPTAMFTDILIDAATTSPEGVATALRQSPHRIHFEPLLAGLDLLGGRTPDVPEEVLEVGKDVAERIERRAEELEEARRTATP